MKKSELKSTLISKFGFESTEGGRHEHVTLWLNQKKVATTYFSRNIRSAALAPNILRLIASQIRLEQDPLATLRGMVSCSVSRKKYLKLLEDNGYLN